MAIVHMSPVDRERYDELIEQHIADGTLNTFSVVAQINQLFISGNYIASYLAVYESYNIGMDGYSPIKSHWIYVDSQWNETRYETLSEIYTFLVNSGIKRVLRGQYVLNIYEDRYEENVVGALALDEM